MAGIRVLLACPRLKPLDAWKSALSQEPDIEVVGEAGNPIETLLSAGSTRADVVVIDLPPARREPGLPSHLLSEYPGIKVVGVSPEGEVTVVYSVGIVRQEVQPVSAKTFSQLIRALSAQRI